MKKKIIAAVLVVVLLIGGTGLFYISGTGHVSSKSEVVQVTVKKGENADKPRQRRQPPGCLCRNDSGLQRPQADSFQPGYLLNPFYQIDQLGAAEFG